MKKNVLQTVALLKEYGISQIVLSPGSRNAPLIQTFSSDSFFSCHLIIDERNAAFYALGIIQALHQPVAICCTSGSALLNYAPAVSEAYYQQLPLVVLSADRSPEWIGQMDGQTIPQIGAFNSLVEKSVNLSEIKTTSEEWFCNRLLNEALTACLQTSKPVHINIPLSEPLFDYSEKSLPEVRKIEYTTFEQVISIKPFEQMWHKYTKKLIIVGQQFESPKLIRTLEELAQKQGCVIFTESLANCFSPHFITNFDTLLSILSEEEKIKFVPDLVITFGGHIVSKKLKFFLRQNKPKQHWHLSRQGEVIDLFQSLTNLIVADPHIFLNKLKAIEVNEIDKHYNLLWGDSSSRIKEPVEHTSFSDIQVADFFLNRLSEHSVLHLANSSVVRNIQLFMSSKKFSIYCNRGVNGIEGALPTAIGFASVKPDIPVYLAVGDLSFFYGVGALWNIEHITNLRIVLFNNRGGGIFHLLPGLDKAESLNQYVGAEHNTLAEKWALAAGFSYLSASNKKALAENLDQLMNKDLMQSVIIEVFTDMETNKEASKEYYNKLKNIL